jgi:threonine dehydrogenase-like Zn-dependent dehydrogenase
MPWAASLAAYVASVTPVDQATGSVTGYIIGYGPLGIIALAMAWLMFRGWRLASPDREAAIRESGRADLLKELERVLAEKHQAEDQRDDAMRFATDQLVPLLTSFTATTAALIPLLQELVRYQGGGSSSDLPRRRR